MVPPSYMLLITFIIHSSIFTFFLIRASITLSSTFKTCSSSFIPLYELHSRAFPLPLYTFTIQLLFQSTGTTPVLTTSLQISVTHFTPGSPAAVSISAATPDGPVALPLFVLNIISLILLDQLILLFYRSEEHTSELQSPY